MDRFALCVAGATQRAETSPCDTGRNQAAVRTGRLFATRSTDDLELGDLSGRQLHAAGGSHRGYRAVRHSPFPGLGGEHDLQDRAGGDVAEIAERHDAVSVAGADDLSGVKGVRKPELNEEA